MQMTIFKISSQNFDENLKIPPNLIIGYQFLPLKLKNQQYLSLIF
jgi:hypothetical protein